jgi:predicted nucleic acid-binding protein
MGLKITPKATYALDTAPLIYLIEQNPTYIDSVRAFFTNTANQYCTLTTSLITYIEVLTLPQKLGKNRLAAKYRAFLTNSENLTLFPINIQVADRSVFYRSTYGFKTPDAIQLAVAEISGADAFLTNDSQLKRCKEVPVYLINEI